MSSSVDTRSLQQQQQPMRSKQAPPTQAGKQSAANSVVGGPTAGGGGGGKIAGRMRELTEDDSPSRLMENFQNAAATVDDIARMVAKFPKSTTMEHLLKTGGKIVDLFEMGQLCDVAIKAEEKTFGCHVEVLACKSDLFSQANDPVRQYLEVMMDSSTLADNLKKLLEYFYYGRFQCDYSSVYSILRAAEKLQVQPLIKLCRKFLGRILVARNLIYVLEAAEQAKVYDLFQLAHEKLKRSFYAISKDEQFLQWDVAKVLRFLSHDEMQINTEFDIFTSCFKWIDFSRPERLKYLRELMACVRFGQMSRGELVECARYDPSINDNDEVRELIADANWMLTLQEKNRNWSQYALPKPRPRPGTEPGLSPLPNTLRPPARE